MARAILLQKHLAASKVTDFNYLEEVIDANLEASLHDLDLRLDGSFLYRHGPAALLTTSRHTEAKVVEADRLVVAFLHLIGSSDEVVEYRLS